MPAEISTTRPTCPSGLITVNGKDCVRGVAKTGKRCPNGTKQHREKHSVCIGTPTTRRPKTVRAATKKPSLPTAPMRDEGYGKPTGISCAGLKAGTAAHKECVAVQRRARQKRHRMRTAAEKASGTTGKAGKAGKTRLPSVSGVPSAMKRKLSLAQKRTNSVVYAPVRVEEID